MYKDKHVEFVERKLYVQLYILGVKIINNPDIHLSIARKHRIDKCS
jgi:hypothetical protein